MAFGELAPLSIELGFNNSKGFLFLMFEELAGEGVKKGA